MARTKRIYEPSDAADGTRVLVDRLWPRGVSKEDAAVDWWAKEVAPSTELRRWYGHDPDRYAEFAERYRAELDGNEDLAKLREMDKCKTVTLLYAARDEEHAHARVLKETLAEGWE